MSKQVGFSRKKAEQFFETLIRSGVKRVIDTRLKIFPNWLDLQKSKIYKIFSRKLGVLNISIFLI